MVWIVIIVIIALLVIGLITLYNRFVRLRNRVDNAWAQIEVQLKRRWDLIPNLVETVRGYAEHERGTFEAVTEARAKVGSVQATPEVLDDPQPDGVQAIADDRRRGLRVPAAAERAGDPGCVDPVRAAPGDDKDAAVHLDEQDEGAGVREVDDLVREVRDAFDVHGPRERSDQGLLAARVDRFERLEQMLEELALVVGERHVQVRGDELLARAVPQAPGECIDVALGRRRVRERARVLVDPEGERRRLEGGRAELALGEDADERRRQRSVVRQHGLLRMHPLRGVGVRVVVEQRLLHGRVERDLLQLAEAGSARRLDDDEAPDRVQLEPRDLDD